MDIFLYKILFFLSVPAFTSFLCQGMEEGIPTDVPLDSGRNPLSSKPYH